jgi:hypothetical protein
MVKAKGEKASKSAAVTATKGQAAVQAPEAEADAEVEVEGALAVGIIPSGLAKSGRVWKTKQTTRFSIIKRSGMLNHLNKSFEMKQAERAAHQNMKELERELKAEKKAKIEEEKQVREERQKRRLANEYKSSTFQVIKPETMKSMSKKQLRMVRKTSMNKNGVVELQPLYGSKR